MCARYTFIPEIALRKPLPPDICFPEDVEPHYNIAPGQFSHVARWLAGDPRCDPMQWGFAPGWLDPAMAQINLRAETLFGTLMFDESARRRRCIVLATGWYDWPDEGHGTYPRYYYRKDGGLIGFAGIWTRNYPAQVDTFAVVTAPIDPTSTFIHNRTPVVLEEDCYGLWLNPAVSRPETLMPLMGQYEPPDLASREVDFHINDPLFDSPKCIERLHQAETKVDGPRPQPRH